MYDLREYQKKAVDDILESLRSSYKKPVVAVLPTAGGKSLIIAETILQYDNACTLVLQPSVELLEQNYEKFTAQGGVASLYSASVGIKEKGHITYATPGSVRDHPQLFQDVRLIIIDECHLQTGALGKIAVFIRNLHKDVKVIGLTATPIKLKNYMGFAGPYSQLNMIMRIRPRFWHKIIHVTQVKELYDKEYLCPLRFTLFDFDMQSSKTRGRDYDLEDVSKRNEKRNVNEFAVRLINESIKRGKKKILVFTPTVQDAHNISRQVLSSGVIEAKTKKKARKALIKEFKEGDLKVLLNYGTLATGFDVPEIDLIVCLRPTKSYAIWYQLVGRGIRISPHKEVCDVVDLSGNYKVFGDPKHLVYYEHPDYGWGIFIKKHLISGIPLGQKIHYKDLYIQNKKLTFGAYEGMAFKDVPTSYLQFMADNFDLSSAWSKRNIVKPLKILGIIK